MAEQAPHQSLSLGQLATREIGQLLTRYISHTCIGPEMGFGARSLQDVAAGYLPLQLLDRVCRRQYYFNTNGGALPGDPDQVKMSLDRYLHSTVTIVRWLPLCLLQASGLHESLVKQAQQGSPRARWFIDRVLHFPYRLGYFLYPRRCQELNPNLPVGLDESETLFSLANQKTTLDALQ